MSGAADHRALSLQFLSVTGLIPVKVRPGQKDPFPEWDPRRVQLEDHSATIKALAADTRLNLGALFAGKYVDLDVDCYTERGKANTGLINALEVFMPKTPYVWGRKSKLRSHRVYALHEDFERGPYGPILRYIKNLNGPKKGETYGAIDEQSYSLEIRGGKPENGLFSVLPGSTHPSGERVEWTEGIDPTVGGAFIEVSRLIRALRLSVATALLVPHWQSGTRNDLSLALAGTLWRVRHSSLSAYGLDHDEEPPEGQYLLTEDDALAILDTIMLIAGDEENDRRSRILNFKNTWRKLTAEPETKITGGKVLAALIGDPVGLRVVKALYRLLSDNEAAEQLEALAEQFVMWYGQGVLIDMKMVKNSRSVPWMTRIQAENSLAGKNLTIGDKKIPTVKLLFSSAAIQRVHGLTFDPSTPELLVTTPEGLMVNQWRGYLVEPSDQRVTAEQVEPFITYVREVIANGNEEYAHWVFAWLADLLINPDKKPGTALVLVGVEGAGKTFLGEHILRPIIGPTHSGQTNSVSTLTHNFNTIIDNKIFIQCDEAVHSYQRDVASRLKSLITDKDIIIEPKGINAYRKPNHIRLMFTSNEEHAAIFISPSPYERRFTVLRVSSQKAKDEKYWDMMHLWTPQALPKIMRWLLDYRYERWLVMRPLQTEAKRNIQRTGVDTEVSWILSRIAQGFPLGEKAHEYWFEAYDPAHILDSDRRQNVRRRDYWPTLIVYSALEADYKDFVRGLGKQVYTGSVSTTIRKVLPPGSLKNGTQMSVRFVNQKTGMVTMTRTRLQHFPTAQEILDHLKTRYGSVVDQIMEENAVVTEDGEQHSVEQDRGQI